MSKYIFLQAFQESVNGIVKGSMNRVIAFLIALTIAFVYVWCTVSKQQIPEAAIVELISFATVLLGISGYNKMVDTKSTTANPNIPQIKQ